MAIFYHRQDTRFVFRDRRRVSAWIKECAGLFLKEIGDLSIVFCSDDYVLKVNRQYLQHDYFTDIITFDYSEGDVLAGDLIISTDSVKSNACEFGVMFHVELLRVVVHGVLHLAGLKDKSKIEAAEMRRAEEKCLSLWYEKYAGESIPGAARTAERKEKK